MKIEELEKLIEKFKLKIPQETLKYLEEFREEREMMVDEIEEKGVKDERVLLAMRLIPRHIFISEEIR